MKKKVALIMVMTMLVGTGCGTSISASQSADINIMVEGESVELSASPQIADGITFAPVKSVFEAMGYSVNWESTSKKIYAIKNKNTIVLTMDEDTANLNGEEFKLEYRAASINNTMYLSLEDIGSLTGNEIVWDADKTSVNITENDEKYDESWKSNEVSVDLSTVGESTYSITGGGIYTLTGDYEGMISINTDDRVKLILNNANITNSNGPAIYVENSNKTIIETAEGSENNLTDGTAYENDAKGCIFSNDDIEFKGSGLLNIKANYNHGIASDDDIKIEAGAIKINSVGDGIHANDGVSVKDGTITIVAAEDGIQAEMYVNIDGGDLNITTTGEVSESVEEPMGGFGNFGGRGGRENGRMREMPQNGSDSQPPEMPQNGSDSQPPEMPQNGTDGQPPEMPQNGSDSQPPERHGDSENALEEQQGGRAEMNKPKDSGNGAFQTANAEASSETTTEYPSSKGIKADTNIVITGGNVTVNSNDHCIKCEGVFVADDGKITLGSKKGKGIKAVRQMFINGGTISIDSKDEGLESKATATINGGEINIKSDDDGVNAGGGSGAEIMNNVQDGDEHQIVIRGGKLTVDAKGDGLDSNGNLYFYGGEIIINGPTSGGDGSLDSASENVLYGGTLFAVGSMGMVECPEAGGDQLIFNINLDDVQTAGSSVVIMDHNNNAIYEAVASKEFQNIIFSSADIAEGESYSVYINGEQAASLTAEKGVSTYGSTGFGDGRGGKGGFDIAQKREEGR